MLTCSIVLYYTRRAATGKVLHGSFEVCLNITMKPPLI